MFTLNYKVTTSCCDENGKLKLYSALQMMQDCSEMWINTEAGVKKYFEENGMAQLLVFLAGEGAGYITGQVFGVNGGLVI